MDSATDGILPPVLRLPVALAPGNCFTSRVENGHTVPSLETLEKYARALEVPLYQLFYEGEEPLKPPPLPRQKPADALWGSKRKEARELHRFCRALAHMSERDRNLLLAAAQRMARRGLPRPG